jgi:RNA-directed DNA polymerase
MKEPHTEGVANHGDPESCVDDREVAGEALTGACAGWVLSREITGDPGADVVVPGGRQHETHRNTRGVPRPGAVKDPEHVQKLSARELGDLHVTRAGNSGRPGRQNRTPVDARRGEVGRARSTDEAAEQSPRRAAEVVEGRGWIKGNTGEQNMRRTQSRADMTRALERVREAAKRDRKGQLTALLHHVTVERLEAAYLRLKRNAAPGVDGVTWKQYGVRLRENIEELHDRLHRGAYRPKPTRRVEIPKPDGSKRPLGITTVEDKIVQVAVAEVLQAIYEVDFLGFSYGFRPGRGQHDALDALAVGIERKSVSWVLDADIRGFFEAIDHGWMMKFIEHRIGDKRILRLISKWLKAGVFVQGELTFVEEGTPQGASISPLLANIYLHYVFDHWVHQWRKRNAPATIVVRFADDFVLGFQRKADAERCWRELGERLKKFGLELHPEKTRLIRFGRYALPQTSRLPGQCPGKFDFLGFTHMCGKTREGDFLLMRLTKSGRMRAKLHEVKEELRRRMHDSIHKTGEWLASVVRGHVNYYGVPTNSDRIRAFRREVTRYWMHALIRRSQKRRLNWERMKRIVKYHLPYARIHHPWPRERFFAIHPR